MFRSPPLSYHLLKAPVVLDPASCHRRAVQGHLLWDDHRFSLFRPSLPVVFRRRVS